MELGLVDYPVESWNGLFAPSGTPPAIIEKLAQIMREMAKEEALQKRMAEIGSIAVANSPDEYAAMLRTETEQWAKALRVIGLAK
jgi:tripartite-type tricarboxylate transporter receptor subunit TctC